jgi:hypothetical protein
MKQAALFAMSTKRKPEDEPQIRPHAARFCSDLASPLLRAQAKNDQAQARLGFDAFDLPLFQATGRRGR